MIKTNFRPIIRIVTTQTIVFWIVFLVNGIAMRILVAICTFFSYISECPGFCLAMTIVTSNCNVGALENKRRLIMSFDGV